MWQFFINILIFCLVLFIYLHIYFHNKICNDLEIFHIDNLDNINKDYLEEILDHRQPVIIDHQDEVFLSKLSWDQIYNNNSAFDIKIRNKNDNSENSDLYINLPLESANKLFEKDQNNYYFSEFNKDFIQETGLNKIFSSNDSFLRPYMVCNMEYDLMMGKLNTYTPFRYNCNYRNFFMVTDGSVRIKITNPSNSKYLLPEYDYENFEFKSQIDIWNPSNLHKSNFKKLKFLEVDLIPGQIFFIPAYWWVSVKFTSKNTVLSTFNYRTYMNNLAITPCYLMHFLQLNNIKTKSVKLDSNFETTDIKNMVFKDEKDEKIIEEEKDKETGKIE